MHVAQVNASGLRRWQFPHGLQPTGSTQIGSSSSVLRFPCLSEIPEYILTRPHRRPFHSLIVLFISLVICMSPDILQLGTRRARGIQNYQFSLLSALQKRPNQVSLVDSHSLDGALRLVVGRFTTYKVNPIPYPSDVQAKQPIVQSYHWLPNRGQEPPQSMQYCIRRMLFRLPAFTLLARDGPFYSLCKDWKSTRSTIATTRAGDKPCVVDADTMEGDAD